MSIKSTLIESAVAVLRKLGGLAKEAWVVAKEQVWHAEELGKEGGIENKGEVKFRWAVLALTLLFPSLSPGWAALLVQAAWLLWQVLGWKRKEGTEATGTEGQSERS